MLKRYDLTLILRILSLALFFVIPGLYLPEMIPICALPVLSIILTFSAIKLEKTRLRLIPLLTIAVLVIAGFYLSFFLFTILFKNTVLNRIFLNLALMSWIFYLLVVAIIMSTVVWIRSNKWKIAEPLILLILFCLFFWSQDNHAITLFSHPIFLAIFTFFFLLLFFSRIFLQPRKNLRLIVSLTIFLPFLVIGIFFVLRTFNALSVSNNGGLIQPTLFRFDFSPYLTLQNEIKMNDALVLIVHTSQENSNTLLRRVYLSGWNPRKGFFEQSAPGESSQIKEVPKQTMELPHPSYKLRTSAEQEYFIVNFDPSSLIAMDYPVKVIPYKIWDSTSFNGAYSVTSNITGFIPFELYDSSMPTGNKNEGMDSETLSFYTSIDTDTRLIVEDTARTLTKNIPGYYDKILALTSFFHDGQFRYSLKPGIAPDGNQLRYFLQDTKKGYCTYFAFSLCLMLRSIGIPSRVTAGFFIQPDSGALDYYPIRANMAHAWVEVFFPKYGWIAFDPTTTTLAEGENIQISSNAGGEEFLQLLNEIIEKRNLLIPDNSNSSVINTGNPVIRLFNTLLSGMKRTYGLFFVAICILTFFVAKLCRFLIISHSNKPRKVVLLVADEMYRFLKHKGNKRSSGQTRRAFILSLNDEKIFSLFELEQKARYAQICTKMDAEIAKKILKDIKQRYSKTKVSHLFLLLFSMIAFIHPYTLVAQPKTQPITSESTVTNDSANALLAQAKEAISVENWETAISLLTSGIHLYPANPTFHFTLGTLYSDKSLYTPARSEYLAALALGFTEPEIYSRLADSSSYLNRDEEAFLFLKKYLDQVPDDLLAWSNFGWLCYKTNRLDEGIQTLHRITESYGPDGNLYVGLGNLYTAAFNYAEARKYYTLAINMAKDQKQLFLSSIDYYNRSILEEVFYHFEQAYEDTKKSLEATPRSSGFLMQGELELRRLQFKAAFTQYLKAFNLDSTPLASMGLADTLIQAGYPDQAANYLETILKRTDLSWIANYGTTTDQFKADLHKIQKDLYLFRTNAEKRKVVHSLYTGIQKQWNIEVYSLYYWYHDALYRTMTKRVAHYYEKSEKEFNKITGQGLHVNSFYYLAFDKWHYIAEPYLHSAMKIETTYIPAAKPSYIYEQAHLTGKHALFDEAIRTLDPEWERQYLSKALSERIQSTSDTEKELKGTYLRNLYLIHPAAFVIYNLQLPVAFTYAGKTTYSAKKDYEKICRLLQKTGFKKTDGGSFSVDILSSDTTLKLVLRDRNNNSTICSQVFHKNGSFSRDLYVFINTFSTSVFKTDLGI